MLDRLDAIQLQWGHDPKTVDGRAAPRPDDASSGGFNGATIRRPWMANPLKGGADGGRWLQWGHDPKTVDGQSARDEQGGGGGWLQWGHDPKTVDGWLQRPPRRAARLASMGPRSEDRGWHSQVLRRFSAASKPLQWGHDPKTVDGAALGLPEPADAHEASMGPRSEDRGWLKEEQKSLRAERRASMGPRSEDRGWARSLLYPCCPACGLQWGHDPKTVDGNLSALPANVGRAGFNGATIRRPWMARARSPRVRSALQASMGPRSEDRGWSMQLSARLPLIWCFNGATIRRPWMAGGGVTIPTGFGVPGFNGATIRRPWMVERKPGALPAGLGRLQWGHDPKTVDGLQALVREVREHEASMGPRSEDRGWPRNFLIHEGAAFLLQWGHDPKTVDGDSDPHPLHAES